MIHKSWLGKKVGRGVQWITDPKQILTAAGFVFGGPVGAGVGRAVGGMTPDPWGNRESTLADGLQWGDLGQAGKDFLSGYSAGKVGQQIPGIQDLEGAFAQGGMWGSPATQAGQLGQAGQAPTGTPSVSIGDVIYDPAQQGVPTPGSFEAMKALDPGSAIRESEFVRGAGGPGGPPSLVRGAGGPGGMPNFNRDLMRLSDAHRASVTGAIPPTDIGITNTMGVPPPGYGATIAGPPTIPAQPGADWGNQSYMRGVGMSRREAPDFLSKMGGRAMDAKDAVWSGFQNLSPLEKMWVGTQVADVTGSMIGGGEPQIGEEGIGMLGEMGMFSPTQRRQPTSFDQWRSRR